MLRFETGIAWAAALLTAMSSSPTQAAEKIELRLRLQEGATYVLRHTLERKARNVAEQEDASSIFESEAEVVHVLTTEYGFHVEELNADQTTRARVTFQLKRRINGVALLETRSETEIDRIGRALRPLLPHMNYGPYSGVTQGEILIDVKPTG